MRQMTCTSCRLFPSVRRKNRAGDNKLNVIMTEKKFSFVFSSFFFHFTICCFSSEEEMERDEDEDEDESVRPHSRFQVGHQLHQSSQNELQITRATRINLFVFNRRSMKTLTLSTSIQRSFHSCRRRSNMKS